MKCPTCESCEYEQYCGATEIMRECERHNKKVKQTNEEWFCELSTEEKARFLEMICYSAWGDKNSRFKDMADYTDWMEWLKEKHE